MFTRKLPLARLLRNAFADCTQPNEKFSFPLQRIKPITTASCTTQPPHPPLPSQITSSSASLPLTTREISHYNLPSPNTQQWAAPAPRGGRWPPPARQTRKSRRRAGSASILGKGPKTLRKARRIPRSGRGSPTPLCAPPPRSRGDSRAGGDRRYQFSRPIAGTGERRACASVRVCAAALFTKSRKSGAALHAGSRGHPSFLRFFLSGERKSARSVGDEPVGGAVSERATRGK